jgi:hypothetical protein
MTTHREHRCGHCGVRYWYQASGHGCGNNYNDSRFCTDCMQVVSKALSSVPSKVDHVWVPTKEVDLLTLKAWEAERLKRQREGGGLVFQRVSFPLFNTETWEKQETGIVYGLNGREGRTYQYHYWKGHEDEVEITIEMERDLATGLEVPWKNL